MYINDKLSKFVLTLTLDSSITLVVVEYEVNRLNYYFSKNVNELEGLINMTSIPILEVSRN